MKRWVMVVITVGLAAAGLFLARPGEAGAQDGESPTPTPTETMIATTTPAPLAQVVVVEPDGASVLYQSSWTAGERAAFDGEVVILAALGLFFIYSLVKEWMR